MVTWSTWIPRSVSSSSTSRYDSATRRYQRTANTMMSGGKQKPAKADEAIGAGLGRRVVMRQSACRGSVTADATAPSESTLDGIELLHQRCSRTDAKGLDGLSRFRTPGLSPDRRCAARGDSQRPIPARCPAAERAGADGDLEGQLTHDSGRPRPAPGRGPGRLLP